MSEKQETVKIGSYLLAKNGKTKYLKLEASPKADEATKDLVERLKAALGGDVIYVNVFDDAFKQKHKILDFVKGNISVPVGETKVDSESDEVNF